MFDLFSANHLHFQLFFEVTERGKLPSPGLRAEHENPFLAYSRLYLGIWMFCRIVYCIWSNGVKVWGQIPPHFLPDGARDLFKINEKMIGSSK